MRDNSDPRRASGCQQCLANDFSNTSHVCKTIRYFLLGIVLLNNHRVITFVSISWDNVSPCLTRLTLRLLNRSFLFQGLNADQRQPQFSRNPHPEPGVQQQQTNDTYIGPDNLRNAANKMFARNGNERSSGYNGNIPPPVSYPNHQPPTSQTNFHYQQNLNQSQHSLNQSLNQSMEMQLSSDQQRQSQMQPNHQSRMRQNSAEDQAKRNSYGNQSFRNAIQTPGVNPHPPKPGQQQRLPPQVPPKPGSRSASKERPKDPNTEENDHLETELNNILRGNGRDSFDKTNGSGKQISIKL